ncbi:hypothetical protein MtrunA17_Chr7g0265541 [Medicago truncatula]|uniref:Uncharacterized protein n=1 Tax=Medicago truncatula TaxID=3880 RepID=A0A072U3Z7_MEDTR|nr:hypothetical protein MTR_7g103370 [Medicago truncatula]RHN48603.1 hypothetical protein MtrunA17_Chr7g0265541 [Medicago truncatula]
MCKWSSPSLNICFRWHAFSLQDSPLQSQLQSIQKHPVMTQRQVEMDPCVLQLLIANNPFLLSWCMN